VRLDAGPGLAQIWTSSSGAPALIVARAKAPRRSPPASRSRRCATTSCRCPDCPTTSPAQLRTFTADGSVLPLPVPADLVATSQTEVDGHPATVLEGRELPLTGVVWVDDDAVTVVAGSLDVDEVLSVARNLG
jgi:hypothetical protein